MEQRTDSWLLARLGNVGCSRLSAVLANGKGGEPSITRATYMTELLCERLTGRPTESYCSPEMQWGTDTEPLARSLYEARTGSWVAECFGTSHPDIPRWRGSPDGLIGDDGGIEIKCPNTKTHIETLTKGTISRAYILQMAGYVEIFKRKWYDFVSYAPRLPSAMHLYIKRFTRDELPIDEVKKGVIMFLEELDALESNLRSKYDVAN